MLGDAAANTHVEVTPYPTLDDSRWTAWWGKPKFSNNLDDVTAETDEEIPPYPMLDDSWWTAWRGKQDPKFPNNWNPGDGTLVMSLTSPQRINAGDIVLAGYTLSMPGGHPAVTVSLAGGNIQTDVYCPDGDSYTLTIPLPNESYSIPADDDSWFPSPHRKSPLVYQGSAMASTCSGGVAKSAYFSALGVSSGTGNPGGPGFPTTDTTYPLKVKFHYANGSHNGVGGSWSPTVIVNYKP